MYTDTEDYALSNKKRCVELDKSIYMMTFREDEATVIPVLKP